MGYVASAASVPIFLCAKEIAELYFQMKIEQAKKSNYTKPLENFLENMAMGIAIQLQIKCPNCSQFENWAAEPNEINDKIIENIEIQNNKK